MKQLLMKWISQEVIVPEPEMGYYIHQYRRGGDSILSEKQFRVGWLRTIAQNKRRVEDIDYDRLTGDPLIPDDGFFLILTAENEIAATAMVQLGEHTPDSATLHLVVTDVEHRGHHLGSIVTAAAMRYVYDHKIKEMYLTTDDWRIPAIKTYLRLGFIPVLWDADMKERWIHLLPDVGEKEIAAYDMENQLTLLKRPIIHFSPNGKNRTPDVVQALLHAQDGTVLYFENGIYDFYEDGCYEGYFCPSCNRSSDKKVVFPLLSLRGISIEGDNAEFLFHDKLFPFIIQNCKTVSLHGFSIDFAFPRCLIAKVEKVDETGIQLSVDRKQYDYYVNTDGNLCVKASGKLFSNCERRFSFVKYGALHCFIASGKRYYDDNGNNLPSNVLFYNALETENGFCLQYTDETTFKPHVEPGWMIQICFDTYRDNDVFFLENSSNISFDTVRVFTGEGMGIIGQCCENIRINQFTIAPHTSDEWAYATTADGILLTNCTGTVQIENSLIDRSKDDAMSIHGFYTKVERIVSPTKVLTRLMHMSQGGTNIYRKGDVLHISDGSSMDEIATATVVEAYLQDDPYLVYVEFDSDITEIIHPGDYLDNPDRTPEIIVRNCTFHNAHCIRFSSSKPTVFENNFMDGMAGLVLNDLMRFWYVSGCARDVMIRRNRFENMNCAIQIIMERLGTTHMKHHNISIEENAFVNCHQALQAESVDTLIFRNNELDADTVPMKIKNCVNVQSDAQ